MTWFPKTLITLLKVGTAVDTTIICLKGGGEGGGERGYHSCFQSRVPAAWHSIWKLNFHWRQDLQWGGKSKGLQVVTALNWTGKGQINPRSEHSHNNSLFTGQWCSWSYLKRPLISFCQDIHIQNLWFSFHYLRSPSVCPFGSRLQEPSHDPWVCLTGEGLRVSGRLRGKSGGPGPWGTVPHWLEQQSPVPPGPQLQQRAYAESPQPRMERTVPGPRLPQLERGPCRAERPQLPSPAERWAGARRLPRRGWCPGWVGFLNRPAERFHGEGLMEAARVERVDAAHQAETPAWHRVVSFLTLHRLKGPNRTEDNRLGIKAYKD